MKYTYKVGIYIGRFQPFHIGHLKTVETMLQKCEKVIISIGSAHRAQDTKNPWTVEERIEMIKLALSNNPDSSKVVFQGVRDYMYNDTMWAAELFASALANGATYDKQTALFGHFKDDSSYYLNMFPQWKLETLPNFKNIDATTIRKDFFENGSLSKESCAKLAPQVIPHLNLWIEAEKAKGDDGLFREYKYESDYLKSWASAPYAPTFVTGDSLVIISGHILLIRRGRNPGKGKLALPGGFINQGEYIKDGILRELKEETKIRISKDDLYKYLGDGHSNIRVFDHPKRSRRGRIITHCGLINLGVGQLPEVKADDDAAEALWLPLASIHTMSHLFFEDHYDIIVNMTSKF